MIKKNIETTDTQKIIITQVGGNLNLKGWDQSDIRFSSTAEAGQIEENEHEIRISCPGNCSLRVPHSRFSRRAAVMAMHGGGQLRDLRLVERELPVAGGLRQRYRPHPGPPRIQMREHQPVTPGASTRE